MIEIKVGKTGFDLSKVRMEPRLLMMAATRAVRTELRKHFALKDKRPNKLSPRRSHFWGEIRTATVMGRVTQDEGTVIIKDARFNQKLYGGTITAKTPWGGSGLRLLTIPVHPEAYNRRAAVLANEKNLKLVFMGNAGGGIIAEVAKESGDVTVYYACRPSVNQRADPTAMPEPDKLQNAAIKAVNKLAIAESIDRTFGEL